MQNQKKRFKLIIAEGQEIWLSLQELQVIDLWREMKFGSLTIKVQDGTPQDLIKMDKHVNLKKDGFTSLFNKSREIFDGENSA